MSRNSVQSEYNPVAEFEYAMSRWSRLANEVVRDSVRIGQPLMDAYFKGISLYTPRGTRQASARCCDIPETACPPRCVCELSWDVSQGDVAQGTLDICNSGKQAISFQLDASDFTSDQGDSGIEPALSPSSFSLAPGATKKVSVSVQVGNGFEANEQYESEIKIRGRYEQCVRLNLYVRRRQTPHCKVEHGEIPRRIVAHHWYDHFQCEELCFEPITQSTGSVPATAKITAEKLVTKTASKRKSGRSKGGQKVSSR